MPGEPSLRPLAALLPRPLGRLPQTRADFCPPILAGVCFRAQGPEGPQPFLLRAQARPPPAPAPSVSCCVPGTSGLAPGPCAPLPSQPPAPHTDSSVLCVTGRGATNKAGGRRAVSGYQPCCPPVTRDERLRPVAPQRATHAGRIGAHRISGSPAPKSDPLGAARRLQAHAWGWGPRAAGPREPRGSGPLC